MHIHAHTHTQTRTHRMIGLDAHASTSFQDGTFRLPESAGPSHVSTILDQACWAVTVRNHSTGHCRNRLLSERWSALLTNVKPLIPLHMEARILGAALLRSC